MKQTLRSATRLLGGYITLGALVLAAIGVGVSMGPLPVQASHSVDGPYEIVAGTTGSFSASVGLHFGGGNKLGTVNGNGTGINFNSVFVGQGYCSNGQTYADYATTTYDATGVTGITQPTTLYLPIDAMEDTGGECEAATGVVEVVLIPNTPQPSFTCSTSPGSQTMDAGSAGAVAITTQAQNGFSSPVNFSASVSPSGGNVPTITFTNNDQTPSATTIASVTTNASTSAGVYTVTFTGNGGGVTQSCSAQVVVNPLTPDFELTLSPAAGVSTTPPNRALKGTNPQFTVFAACTGGFNGPITNLTATSTFQGVTLSLSATTVACGSTVTLTVNNTAAVPANQSSTPTYILSEGIQVTGTGIIGG